MIKIPVEDLEPAFENAIHWLANNRNIDTVGGILQWFKLEFGGYAFHDQLFNWEYVVFPKEEDATMFMLRFS